MSALILPGDEEGIFIYKAGLIEVEMIFFDADGDPSRFYVSVAPISQDTLATFLGSHGKPLREFSGSPSDAVFVSLGDAIDFCDALGLRLLSPKEYTRLEPFGLPPLSCGAASDEWIDDEAGRRLADGFKGFGLLVLKCFRVVRDGEPDRQLRLWTP